MRVGSPSSPTTHGLTIIFSWGLTASCLAEYLRAVALTALRSVIPVAATWASAFPARSKAQRARRKSQACGSSRPGQRYRSAASFSVALLSAANGAVRFCRAERGEFASPSYSPDDA
jgi:hypothetical protein